MGIDHEGVVARAKIDGAVVCAVGGVPVPLGLKSGGTETDEIIARACIDRAVANGPGIGLSTCCAGAHEELVVARAKIDGAVVDGDSVSISTPPIPAVVSVGAGVDGDGVITTARTCLLYTSPSPRDATLSRMPSSA